MAQGSPKKPQQPLKQKWFHILLTLADRELHGTAIMEEVLQRTGGAIRLWPGALYGALGDLSERGLIRDVEPPDGAPTERGKRRFYAITRRGREALAREVAHMEELVLEARSKRVGEGLREA